MALRGREVKQSEVFKASRAFEAAEVAGVTHGSAARKNVFYKNDSLVIVTESPNMF